MEDVNKLGPPRVRAPFEPEKSRISEVCSCAVSERVLTVLNIKKRDLLRSGETFFLTENIIKSEEIFCEKFLKYRKSLTIPKKSQRGITCFRSNKAL